MRLITVPAKAITLKAPKGGEQKDLAFSEFVTTCLDGYGEIKTPKQWRQSQKVVAALETMNGNLTLEDAEYDLLKAAVQSGGGYTAWAGRQLVDYAEAIEKAEEVKK